MYPTYSTGSSRANPALVRVRPDRPQGVTIASVLMYAAAAISAIWAIILVVFVSTLRKELAATTVNLTQTQLNRDEDAFISIFIFIGIVTVGLWAWMAWANRAGKNWARILSTVFFGIFTLFVVVAALGPHALLGLLPFILVWLIGLAAIVLLWRRESGPYFDPQ
jgi:hypothetical protein